MSVAAINETSVTETLLPAYRILREGLLCYHTQPAFLPTVSSCYWLISQLTPPSEDLARNPDDLHDLFAAAVVVFGLQRPIIAGSPERLEAIEGFLTRAWPITHIPDIEDLKRILELIEIYASGPHPYLWRGLRSLLAAIPKWPKGMAGIALSAIHHFFASPMFPEQLEPFNQTDSPCGIDLSQGATIPPPNDYVTNATLVRVVTNAVKVALDTATQSWTPLVPKQSEAAPVHKRFKPDHEPTFVPRARKG